MFVFHDWPFPHVYFAKNVANIISLLILGSVFSDCVVFNGDSHNCRAHNVRKTRVSARQLATERVMQCACHVQTKLALI